MALTSVPTTRAGSRPTQEAAHRAVKELQGLKVAVVEGAGANTNIAVSGIATADVLVAVLAFDLENETPALTKPTASITSAGNIQTTTSTADMTLVVLYFDVSA